MRALVLDAAQGAHRHGLREAVQEHLGALAALCPSKSAALMLDISPAQAGAAGRAALGELPAVHFAYLRALFQLGAGAPLEEVVASDQDLFAVSEGWGWAASVNSGPAEMQPGMLPVDGETEEDFLRLLIAYAPQARLLVCLSLPLIPCRCFHPWTAVPVCTLRAHWGWSHA